MYSFIQQLFAECLIRDEEMRNSIPALKQFRVGALASIFQWLECQPKFRREEG